MLGVVLGLLAALGWGSADFAARFSSRRLGTSSSLFVMQATGLLAIGILPAITGEPIPDVPALTAMVALGIVNLAAYLALYRALIIGQLSIVSPIVSAYAAVSVVLALASGERPQILAFAGIVLTIAGVMAAAMAPSTGHASRTGVVDACIASILFGVLFWGAGRLGEHESALWIVAVARGVGALGIAASGRARLTRLATDRRGVLISIGAGLCDAAAFIAYTIGASDEMIAIVAPVAALFGVVVVILARVFVRERLSRMQQAGLLILFAGIGLVSAGV